MIQNFQARKCFGSSTETNKLVENTPFLPSFSKIKTKQNRNKHTNKANEND